MINPDADPMPDGPPLDEAVLQHHNALVPTEEFGELLRNLLDQLDQMITTGSTAPDLLAAAPRSVVLALASRLGFLSGMINASESQRTGDGPDLTEAIEARSTVVRNLTQGRILLQAKGINVDTLPPTEQADALLTAVRDAEQA